MTTPPETRTEEKGREARGWDAGHCPEGTAAYHLKVSKKNGMVEHSYLDAEHFLEILQVEKHRTPNGEIELEITWGDYKEVGGLMIPHSWSRRVKGGPTVMTLMFEEMELGAGVPATRFARPGGRQ